MFSRYAIAEIEVAYANSHGLEQRYRKTICTATVTLKTPWSSWPPFRLSDHSWPSLTERLQEAWGRRAAWLGTSSSGTLPRDGATAFTGPAERLLLSLVASTRVGLWTAPARAPALEGLSDSGRLAHAPSARPFDDHGYETVVSPLSRPWVGVGGDTRETGHTVFHHGRFLPSLAALTLAPPAGRPGAVDDRPTLLVEEATLINDVGRDGLIHLQVGLAWQCEDGRVRRATNGVGPLMTGVLHRLSVSPLATEPGVFEDLEAPPVKVEGLTVIRGVGDGG